MGRIAGLVAALVVAALVAPGASFTAPAAAAPIGYDAEEAADLHAAAAYLGVTPSVMHTDGTAVVRFLAGLDGRSRTAACRLGLGSEIPRGDTGPHLVNADTAAEPVQWVASHYCITPVQAARFGATVLTFLAGVDSARTGRALPTVRPPDPSRQAVVLGATDGDTLRVRTADGSEHRLRLVGIDAPERGECVADRATAALARLVGTAVVLEADVTDRDAYGRLLRYVWSEGVLVNELLAGWGLVLPRRYPPDTRNQGRIDAAGRAAERARLGLWDPAACGPATNASLVVDRINADAPGDDARNLNGEWVVIRNAGRADADLTGWTLRDTSASHRYRFPRGFVLGAGRSVTVFSGCGTDGADRLHWCTTGSAIWNNDGDTAFLLDPNGNIAAQRSY